MKRFIQSVTKLLSVIVLISIFPVISAHAAPLETIQVSSLNQSQIFSNTILEMGKMYMIEASGIYTFAPGDRIADAEFAYNPDINSWNEDFGNIYEQYVLDLIVNGEPHDWLGSPDGINYTLHTFSPNHTYRLFLEGQGQPLSFKIFDESYDWNEGGLTVTINNQLPSVKDDCKYEGWKSYPDIFRNQGSCIKNVKLN
jgi:hypothetical protein